MFEPKAPYILPSPAKLNLFLHINAQRDDGYHELQTLFQFLDYGDEISIELTNDNKVSLVNPIAGVNTQDNLIYKAAMILARKKNNTLGAKIGINKVLPMGGGVGGGSSNAATVLLALNKLWQVNLTNAELAQQGLSLGADVPIFVAGTAAFADGVGEKLSPAKPDECWYLVSKPNCSISTALVFNSDDLPRNTAKISTQDFSFDSTHNDCQTMVIKHYPEVANLLAWLVEYAPSRMTGTGACIFTCFDTQDEASRVQSLLPKGVESFVAKGLNQSPVHAIVKNI